MTFSKVSCSILFVSASLLGCSTIISSIAQQGGRMYADGGAPQPPVPKATQRLAGPNVVADGGAPQPPVPPKATTGPAGSNLIADGGAPQPPVPKLDITA